MRALRKAAFLSLALAVLVSSAAPSFVVQSLIPCMTPSDCPAMRELCDMTGMTSHESCCKPGSASDLTSLPAAAKSPFSPAHLLAAAGWVSVLPHPVLLGDASPAALTGALPRSSPFTVAILRI